MERDLGGSGAAVYPAMRELLRQSVTESQADVSFVALTHPASEGNGRPLAIPAVYPPTEASARLITARTRKAVYQAVASGRTEVIAGRARHPVEGRSCTTMLIVAPMYTTNGLGWGAIAALRAAPVIDGRMITVVERCARAITDILVKDDDPDDRLSPTDPAATFPLSQPPEPSTQQATPRVDFLVHELRVPLSAATLALSALEQRLAGVWTDEDKHLAHVAQSGVSEAQTIVRSVNQWPTLGQETTIPQFEPVSVDEALQRALTLLPTASARVIADLGPHLPRVLGNQDWMARVLVNLLENAVKYSSPGSRIKMEARWIGGGFIRVSVHSMGRGLPLERARQQGNSTGEGLGLSIARYFVTSMGGELWMEGGASDASSVTVTLPVACGASTSASTNTSIGANGRM